MLQTSLFSVFLIELVLTAFLVFIIMGVTNRRAPAGFAPLAIGRTLTAIHLMPIPSLSPMPPSIRCAASVVPCSAAQPP